MRIDRKFTAKEIEVGERYLTASGLLCVYCAIKVNYGEGLTEEQWLSAVDNGDDVNALEEAAKKSG